MNLKSLLSFLMMFLESRNGQFTAGGIDASIESVLPFDSIPNFVPLSNNKLNSTYLPLLYN